MPLPLLLLALSPAPAGPAVQGPSAAAAGERVERRVGAMGTLLAIEVTAPDRARALQESERVVRAVERVEARLSSWRPDSELSRLNATPPGRPFVLGPELAADLGTCAALFAETDGAFDPGVGATLRALGLRGPGGRDEKALERARGVGFALLGLDLAAQPPSATRLDERLLLDAGAFGKGVALDAALAALGERGTDGGDALEAAGARSPVLGAVLDFGGQVAMLASDEPRTFAIADPRDRTRPVIELQMSSGSFATTGTSERGAHVVDPRTGLAAHDFGSVSVWSSSATRADALSTALFVMGPEHALNWAAGAPDALVLLLVRPEGGERTLEARASAGLRGRLRVLAADVTLHYDDEGGENH